MDAIGGYFSLELPIHEEYHKYALKLNTGRNCLEYILRCRHYSKIYIPYYTCDVILEPLQKLGIAFDFYHINLDFEITDGIKLKHNEGLLYTNYYGLKQKYIEKLSEKYGQQLIVDNTQAFYAKPIKGIDTFYTCRKFFGVPDGAYLYIDKTLDMTINQDTSYNRMVHLLKRIDLTAEEGYSDFRKADDSLNEQPILRMSKLTQKIMQSIDYNQASELRRENFKFLHESLKKTNKYNIHLDEDSVPMIYPYLTDQKDLRDYLINNKIFVATYWPSVLKFDRINTSEQQLVKQLLPLPIDQRYQQEDMNKILKCIINE